MTSLTRIFRNLLLPASLLLASSLALPGCTEAQKEQFETRSAARKRSLAERLLKDRAIEYWELVRWRSWSQAATYFENEEDQLSFLRDATDASDGPTMDNVEIQYVFIGTKNPHDAEIRIRWTEVSPTQASVVEKSVTQRWYKHHAIWWARPDFPFGEPLESGDSTTQEGSLESSPMNEEPPPELPTVEAQPEAEER